MARIDTGKIEGYKDMTPEQKLAALEAFEYDDGAKEIERQKALAAEASGEAAEWKKKHGALLSEEERKKQEGEEELNTLRKKVAEMERDSLISGHKAQLLSLGYDEALADETAKALADGNTAAVFANQRKFLESHDKAYKAQLMSGTPTPPAGGSSTGGTDYSKMIQDAQARGDVSAAAYYTRLAGQEKQTNS